jgi:hypothetical protein
VKPVTSGLHFCRKDFQRRYHLVSASRRFFYFVAHIINAWSCIDQTNDAPRHVLNHSSVFSFNSFPPGLVLVKDLIRLNRRFRFNILCRGTGKRVEINFEVKESGDLQCKVNNK